MRNRFIAAWAIVMGWAGSCFADVDRETKTPRVIQTTVAPASDQLPDDGASFCVPTSTTMNLYYLTVEGFSRLSPGWNPQDPSSLNVDDALNLDKVLGGLFNTSPYAGTSAKNWEQGITTYLGLKGYSSSATIHITSTPDITGIANSIENTSTETKATVMLLAWREPNGQSHSGHALSLLNVSEEGSGTVTIHNPEPASMIAGSADIPANAQQTFALTTYGSPMPSGLFVVTPENPEDRYGQIATLLEIAINNDAKTNAPNGGAESFHINGPLTIGTNGGYLTAEAPLRDSAEPGAQSGGISKVGEGTLQLTGASNTTTGNYSVLGGTLESTSSNTGSDSPATPFGTGSMTLGGGAELGLRPEVAFNNEANLVIASGNDKSFSVQNGLGVMTIDKGTTNTSLTLKIGGSMDTTTANVNIGAGSSLLFQAGVDLDDLGSMVKITAAGAAGNLPSLIDGKMVSPAIVAKGSGGYLDFLTYDTADGFMRASADSGFGNAADLVRIAEAGTTLASNAAALALTANGTIDEPKAESFSVTLGRDAGPGGLILNTGADMAVSELIFAGDAYIYANGSDTDVSTIGSVVTVPGGVILAETSTGTLALTRALTVASPAGVNINKGNVAVTDIQGSVKVNTGARLIASGTISGPVEVSSMGTLVLNGGTLAGGVSLTANSTPFQSTWVPGGTIEGTGTVNLVSTNSHVTLNGIIGSQQTTGSLTFINQVPNAEISVNAPLMFTLGALKSDGSGVAGVDWSSITLDGIAGEIQSGTINIQVNFANAGIAPSGTDPFWATTETWEFINFGTAITMASGMTWRVSDGNIFQFADVGSFSFAVIDDVGVLTWSPIPEPSTNALLALGALAAGWTVIRKQKAFGRG